MKNEYGVFLDGFKLEPSHTDLIPALTEDIHTEDYKYYRVAVGILTLHFFLDEFSCVKIDSSAYLDLEIPEDNDDDVHAVVTLDYANSYRDAFTGNCTLINVNTNSCTITNSTIRSSAPKKSEIDPLINLRVTNSILRNATVSEGSSVENSSIVNSTVHTKGAGARVESTTMKNSFFTSHGVLDLDNCRFNDTRVYCNGFIRIVNTNMPGLCLKVPDCNIPDRFSFFTLVMPSGTLHFYQTGSDDFAITQDGGDFNVGTQDPLFTTKLKELFDLLEQPLADDAVQYVIDSAKSRMDLLSKLNDHFSKTLGDSA